MIFNYKFKLPILHYGMIVVAVAIIAFVALWIISLDNVSSLDKSIKQSRIEFAKQNIKSAINNTIIKSNIYLRDLSKWDETMSQIGNTQYYSYWKNNRIKEFKTPPFGLKEIKMYTLDGIEYDSYDPKYVINEKYVPLSELKTENSYFFVCKKNGVLLLRHFYTIYSRNDINKKVAYLEAVYYIEKSIMNFLSKSNINVINLKSNIKGDIRNIDIDIFVKSIEFDIDKFSDLDTILDTVYSSWVKIAILGAVVIIITLYGIITQIGTPLIRLSQYLDSYRKNSNEKLPIKKSHGKFGIHEIENVGNAFATYQKHIDELHSELKDAAYHDTMTKVFNRRKFDEDWGKITENHMDNVSIILFDCNNFKAINDTYGHQIGDKVIAITAQLLLKSVRECDDVYRLGGDEFCVILRNAVVEDAKEVAYRCMKLFEDYNFYDCGIKEPVTVSAGIAYSKDDSELAQLFQKADTAMYYAKKPMNDYVQVYSSSMLNIKESVFSNAINNAIISAIKDNIGVKMLYQQIKPLIDVESKMNLKCSNKPQHSGELYYEALVRIQHDGELLTPNKILPIVDSKKLSTEFDEMIIKQIVSDIKENKIPKGVKISINISGASVLDESVMNTLRKYSKIIDRNPIVLELLENEIIPNVDNVLQHLHELKGLGYILALDDFGSGYSSLRYLVTLPIDIIKFDITMVNDLLTASNKEKTVIKNIVKMINDMQGILIAEGIETPEMYEAIQGFGFDYVQGYNVHMPELIDDIFNNKFIEHKTNVVNIYSNANLK